MIKRLLYLNGLAILGVVLYHASGWGFVALFWWTDRYRPVTAPNFDQLGGLAYVGLRLVEQLVIFSVPAFLFVSGFFIAFATPRTQRTVGWNIVGNRVKGLLIPFALWSLAFFAVGFALGDRYSLAVYIRRLLLGQATESYYYVVLLVQFYLLSPLLVLLARQHWKLLLVAAAMLQASVHALSYLLITGVAGVNLQGTGLLTNARFFPGHLFWFSFGVVAGLQLPVLKRFLERTKWALLAATPTLFVLGVLEWERLLHVSGEVWLSPAVTIVDDLYALAFILTILAFERVALSLAKPFSDLGAKSYGIYLTNALVLMVAAKGIYHLAPNLLGRPLILQVILVAFGLGGPLLLMALVNKSPARRYYKYLFG
jgi:probable poly-beta-1,6-N-acetyl-D-glucosamine export protein